MTQLAEGRECPFGAEGRDCKHQETVARDIRSAIEGDIKFLCNLDKSIKCPRMAEMFDAVLGGN